MVVSYDSTLVGVPYVRCSNVAIRYKASALPLVLVEQEWAVKLLDGSIAILSTPISSFSFELDLINEAVLDIPMINPDSGEFLGANTNLQDTLIDMASIIRVKQLTFNV
jgi:hypothetical protein